MSPLTSLNSSLAKSQSCFVKGSENDRKKFYEKNGIHKPRLEPRLKKFLTGEAFVKYFLTKPSDAQHHEPPSVISPQPKKRVLVVDDNPLNRMMAQRLLMGLDCEVELAEDGKQAVDKVKAKKYDLVFMDIEMPGMNGKEATQQIRKDEETTGAHIPIVMFSTIATLEDYAELGFDDFCPKNPMTKEGFQKMISKWVIAEQVPCPLAQISEALFFTASLMFSSCPDLGSLCGVEAKEDRQHRRAKTPPLLIL